MNDEIPGPKVDVDNIFVKLEMTIVTGASAEEIDAVVEKYRREHPEEPDDDDLPEGLKQALDDLRDSKVYPADSLKIIFLSVGQALQVKKFVEDLTGFRMYEVQDPSGHEA